MKNLAIFGGLANQTLLSSKISQSLDVIFSPDVYAAGEALYENKAVLEISKSEGEVYDVFVKDGLLYEVELQKPFTAHQKFKCECPNFQGDKACKHIVAALMGYRDIKKPDKAKKSGKPKTLNINALLHQVEANELTAFVKTYASKDKKFGNALKIHFARKVELENNSDKYRMILDGLVKPVTGTDHKKNSRTDIKVFSQVIDDFLAQAEDALVLHDYVEVFYILKAAIVKASYVIKHFGEKCPISFYKNYQSLHKSLFKLLESKPAPHLMEEIKEFIIATLDLSYYEVITPRYNLIAAGLEFKILSLEVAEAIIDHRLSVSKDETEIPILYSLKIIYYSPLFVIDSKHSVHTSRITQLLIDSKHDDLAFTFLQENIAKKADPDLIRQFSNLLLDKEGENAYKDIAGFYLSHKDLRLFDLAEKRGKDQVEIMVEAIRKHKDFEAFTATIHYPYFLARTGDFDTLLTYLNDKPSLELLMRFDKMLYEHRPNLVTVMYENLIHEYLNQHVGDQSVVFVNNIYGHLYKIGATRLVKRLQDMVTEEFKYRVGK